MLKKLINFYSNSLTKTVFNFLFLNKKLKDGYFLKFYKKIPHFHMISELSLFLSLFLLLYERVISKYFPFNLSILSLIFLIISFIFTKKENFCYKKRHFYLLSFVLIMIVSAIYASRNLEFNILFLGSILYLQFVIAYLLGEMKNKQRLLNNLILLIIPESIWGLYQVLTGVETSKLWLSSGETITTRAFSFFGSPNVFGGILYFGIVATICAFFLRRNKYYLLPLGLFSIVLFFTFSRSSWLALIFSVVIIVLGSKPKLIFLTPLASILLFYENFRERIFSVFSEKYLIDSSLDGRLWSLKNSLYIFIKKPILGTGPGSYGGQIAYSNASPVYLEGLQRGYTSLFYTDNQWLNVLVQAGFIGFLFLILFFVALFYDFVSDFKKNHSIISLVGASAVIGFITLGLFANVIEFAAVSVPAALLLGVMVNNNE